MTLDEYAQLVHRTAVLFGQRFSADDIRLAYRHAAHDWLAACPATAGDRSIRQLEEHHQGRLTLRDLHRALKTAGRSERGGGMSCYVPNYDGTVNEELTAALHAIKRGEVRNGMHERPGDAA